MLRLCLLSLLALSTRVLLDGADDLQDVSVLDPLPDLLL